MKVSEFSLCASHDRGGHVQVETLLVTFPSCSRLFSIDPRIFLPSRLECYEQANLLPTSGGARVASTATCVYHTGTCVITVTRDNKKHDIIIRNEKC